MPIRWGTDINGEQRFHVKHWGAEKLGHPLQLPAELQSQNNVIPAAAAKRRRAGIYFAPPEEVDPG